MEKLLVSLKDNVSGLFDQPGLVQNVEEAKRVISQLVANNQKFADICSDYSLYALGTMNIATGEIKPNFEFLFNAVDFKK